MGGCISRILIMTPCLSIVYVPDRSLGCTRMSFQNAKPVKQSGGTLVSAWDLTQSIAGPNKVEFENSALVFSHDSRSAAGSLDGLALCKATSLFLRMSSSDGLAALGGIVVRCTIVGLCLAHPIIGQPNT